MDLSFSKTDFTQTPLTEKEYESYTFDNCHFSGLDLSGTRFVDCSFTGCNLSLAVLQKTGFMDVRFKGCKMMGLLFTDASDFNFTVSFEDCVLDNSSFYRKKMKKTTFRNTSLKEVDLAECDLTEAMFDHCDLTDAVFDNTILNKADFCTATNYLLDPEQNSIKKTRFSLAGLPGLLSRYDIRIEL